MAEGSCHDIRRHVSLGFVMGIKLARLPLRFAAAYVTPVKGGRGRTCVWEQLTVTFRQHSGRFGVRTPGTDQVRQREAHAATPGRWPFVVSWAALQRSDRGMPSCLGPARDGSEARNSAILSVIVGENSRRWASGSDPSVFKRPRGFGGPESPLSSLHVSRAPTSGSPRGHL